MNEKTLEEINLIKIASFSYLVEVNTEMQMGCIKLIKQVFIDNKMAMVLKRFVAVMAFRALKAKCKQDSKVSKVTKIALIAIKVIP